MSVLAQITLFSANSESVLTVALKEWLLNVGQVSSVLSFSFEENVFDEMDKDATCIFIRTDESDNKIVALVQAVRTVKSECYVLVLDINRMTAKEIKQILLLRQTGIISKNVSGDQLLQYISSLKSQNWVMSTDVKERLLENMIEEQDKINSVAFNEQEKAIIDAANRGLNIKETAAELGLSPNTIAVYRSKMLRKTGLQSFVQLLNLNR